MTTPSFTTLSFTISFHTWFRVGAAYARDGVDAALDPLDPLPADHLKGLMRASAVTLASAKLVGEVFGTKAVPSPWAWTSAAVRGEPGWASSRPSYRVEIDPETHAATKDHLVVGEVIWAGLAGFDVHQVRRLEPPARDEHAALLRVAAAGVHSVGAWRRRGLGWVGVTPDAGPITADDLTLSQVTR